MQEFVGEDTASIVHGVALDRRLTFEDLIPQSLMMPRPAATTIYRIRYAHTEGVGTLTLRLSRAT